MKERYAHEVHHGRFVVQKPRKVKGSPYYYVRIRDKRTGQTRQVSTRSTTVRGARLFVKEWLSEVVEADSRAIDRESFRESLLEYVEQRDTRPSTKDDQRISAERVVAPFFKGIDVCDVSGRNMQDFLAHLLKKGQGWRTRRKYVSLLRGYFAWARTRGLTDIDPMEGVAVEAGEEFEGRALTLEEAQRLLKAAAFTDERWFKAGGREWMQRVGSREHLYHAIVIALNSGLRRGNTLGLEWRHLDLSRAWMTIPASEMKSRRTLSVPIQPKLCEYLCTLRQKAATVSPTARVIGREVEDCQTAFDSAVLRAGIGEMRFHDLRHTFGTLARLSLPEDIVGILLGHAKSKSSATPNYIHRSEEVVVSFAAKLDWIGPATGQSPLISTKA